VDESGVSPVDIIPPWFCVLIYHLGDEQLALWWPQFRDVVCLNDMIMMINIVSESNLKSI
jgi:hypothetical protein